MSTLTVSNVSDGSLSIPTTYVTNGSAKAWIVANGSASVSDSLNVSSGTDHGTGDYSYALTASFADTDFAVVSSGRVNGNVRIMCENAGRKLAGVIAVIAQNTSPTDVDVSHSISAHGDLA